MDAKPGEDLGVAQLNGLIEHEEGLIHVCKVPRVERGGSRKVSPDLLRAAVRDAEMVAAVGLESYVALRKADIEPDMFFGSREGVIEAAFHGRECAILIVDEEFTDFLKRLEATGLAYTIHDLLAS
jgi:putative transcriptional regulator